MIGGLACEDIKAGHMQAVVNAAPTAQEGARLRRCISALVTAGITGGYLANPRIKEVHWQAGDRPAPEPAASIAGEAALYVDPAEIPAPADVARLGQALAVLREEYELMACFACLHRTAVGRAGRDPQEPYAQLRRAFVYKDRPTQTPSYLSGPRILSGSNTRSSR